MGFTLRPSDPFYDLMKPPADETRFQKTARLEREAEDQRINNAIEDQIKEDRARIQREKVNKVLLLGRPESDLRVQYAYAEWTKEQDGWQMVIHLNVVRSINAILKVVRAGIDNNEAISDESIKFTDRHQQLLIRLAPLSIVEDHLKHKLAGILETLHSDSPLFATPFRAAVEDILSLPPRKDDRSWSSFLNQEALSATDPTTSIAIHKDDMKALWNDPVVRMAFKSHRHQIGNAASFFLNEIDRVVDGNYTVTDDDVCKAHLRTHGVHEYCITFNEKSLTCRIFDVCGSRTERLAWVPYFDNVDVILFLASLSVFDERLEEEPTVNRLEDSFVLWRVICSSRLLAGTQLILLLTKCDLLAQKLREGIKINEHIPSYGDRSNEMATFLKYIKDQFMTIARGSSIRPSISLLNSDITSPSLVCNAVQDAVLRKYLLSEKLL